MINIVRKEDCCGCGACFDICSKNAIIWETDCEGFSYPKVDTTKCIDCGLCNKTCPIENSDTINAINAGETPIVLAAYHKNDDIRLSSTSGGAFWGLAENWVKNGGYVAGAVFYDHFKIKHIVTNNLDELQRIKGSKYAQSDTRGLFNEVKHLLKKGEKVLATGLPCQMAALRQFLRRDYDNLLVVDLICHSVTSQFPFQLYLKDLEKKYNSSIINFHPKNKELGGWHKFAFKAEFANGDVYNKHASEDYYCVISYGSSILTRHSCYECHYKHYPQPSDITIGDFWGIENIDLDFDSPKGISKVVLNTNRGKEYFQSLDCFETKEYDAQTAIFDNPRSWSMIKPIKRKLQNKRDGFVNDLYKYDLDYCMNKYLIPKPTFFTKIKRIIKKYANKQ